MSKAQDIIMPERWKTALTEVHPIFRQDTLTIRFLGDVMMHSSQIANTRREGSEYDFSSFFSLIENDIRDADIAVANMEFTLAGEPYTGYPCFSAPTLWPHISLTADSTCFSPQTITSSTKGQKERKGLWRFTGDYLKIWESDLPD